MKTYKSSISANDTITNADDEDSVAVENIIVAVVVVLVLVGLAVTIAYICYRWVY